MTTRPDADELLVASMLTADIAAGLHDQYAETLLHEASTEALQSIAASLITIAEHLTAPDASGTIQAFSHRCAQIQVGEGSTGEQASPSPSAPPAAGL